MEYIFLEIWRFEKRIVLSEKKSPLDFFSVMWFGYWTLGNQNIGLGVSEFVLISALNLDMIPAGWSLKKNWIQLKRQNLFMISLNLSPLP